MNCLLPVRSGVYVPFNRLVYRPVCMCIAYATPSLPPHPPPQAQQWNPLCSSNRFPHIHPERISEKYGLCHICTFHGLGWWVSVEILLDYGIYTTVYCVMYTSAFPVPYQQFHCHPQLPPFQRPSAGYSQRFSENFGHFLRRRQSSTFLCAHTYRPFFVPTKTLLLIYHTFSVESSHEPSVKSCYVLFRNLFSTFLDMFRLHVYSWR
jgi:hypothetical protein